MRQGTKTRRALSAYAQSGGKTMRFLFVLLILLLAGASPATSQTADDRLIVPGVRVGKWTLDTSIPELLRMNGPSGTRTSMVSSFMPSATWYSWEALGFAAGSHDRRKTDFLALHNNRDYAAPRGTGIGASKRTVLAAHGEPTFEGDLFIQGRIVTVLTYNKNGLAFFVDNDRVQVLLIFRPGEIDDLTMGC